MTFSYIYRNSQEKNRSISVARERFCWTGSHAFLVLIFSAFLSNVLLPPQAFSADGLAQTEPCANGQNSVVVGGVTGFSAFANPDSSKKLRHLCVGLYIHAVGWEKLSSQQQQEIVDNLSESGAPTIQLGFNPNPHDFFQKYYLPDFIDKGVFSQVALVNGLCSKGYVAAKAYIDEARIFGVKVVSDVFAPNSGQFKDTTFLDPRWDCVRQTALYGGGIAIDSPPYIFLRYPKAYRDFIISEIRWAKTHSLLTYLILSPAKSQAQFYFDSSLMLKALHEENSSPTNYVFETYDVNDKTGPANKVGSENDPYSVAGVVLRIVSSAMLVKH